MASRKNRGLLALMLLYVAAFLIASLLTGSIGESVEGLGRIIASPSQLTKDYFKLGGISAAFMNTAIIAFMNFLVHWLSGSSLNGLSLIAFFLISGFGFFGINPVNMIPGFLGTLLFSKVTKTKFSSVANVSILSSALGPVVSEMLFRYPVSTLGLPDVMPVRIVLAAALIFTHLQMDKPASSCRCFTPTARTCTRTTPCTTAPPLRASSPWR